MDQQPSWVAITWHVIRMVLWVIEYLLRLLLRPPLISILLRLVALWLVAGLIGRRQQQGVLYQPPTVFEGR